MKIYHLFNFLFLLFYFCCCLESLIIYWIFILASKAIPTLWWKVLPPACTIVLFSKAGHECTNTCLQICSEDKFSRLLWGGRRCIFIRICSWEKNCIYLWDGSTGIFIFFCRREKVSIFYP